MIDLSSLPAPAVVEALDFETILAEIKADLLARCPQAADALDLESEPLLKLMEAFAYRELLYRARVNDAARAHLLAFARGGDLDHLAALFCVQRQPGETDERLRRRLQRRIAALAGQGTREYYEYIAMTASPAVRDARASAPQPGEVDLALWLADDADAAQELQIVMEAINHEAARIVGVPVFVSAARARPIDISACVWRTEGSLPTLLDVLRRRIADAFAAAPIGQGVARSWITTLLHAEGVAAVQFTGDDAPPAAVLLAGDEYPAPGRIDLQDMGLFA